MPWWIGRDKIGVRQRFALVVGNRDQWHIAESGIERLEIAQILPAVKRGQGPGCQRAEKREMKQIDMKMKNVEFLRALAHLIDHQHEVRNDVAHGRIEPKRATATGVQLGAGDRVAACKQRHIVAKPGQVLRSGRKRSAQCRHKDEEERSQ